jgi:hypothetical protein
MSPGATFERVYNELKRMLAEGELPPGGPIEPALIGKQIASSITPIRDALHRLTGERLVEAPNHNGFRVPQPTEAALRDLYNWNGLVLGLAAKQLPPRFALEHIERPVGVTDITTFAAGLFLKVARAGGSVELTIAVGLLNDRLATFRRAEVAALESVTDELSGLANVAATGDRTALAAALMRYHRRRIIAVAGILAHLESSPELS